MDEFGIFEETLEQEQEIFEMPEEKGFEVYAKINSEGFITEVSSNVFIKDYTGWIMIDKNVMGDKGAHAQSQYFDKPLINDDGIYNYSFIGGKIIEK